MYKKATTRNAALRGVSGSNAIFLRRFATAPVRRIAPGASNNAKKNTENNQEQPAVAPARTRLCFYDLFIRGDAPSRATVSGGQIISRKD